MSTGTSVSSAAAASAPTRRTWPMCETSNSAAASRHWRCSAMMPAGYETGMS